MHRKAWVENLHDCLSAVLAGMIVSSAVWGVPPAAMSTALIFIACITVYAWYKPGGWILSSAGLGLALIGHTLITHTSASSLGLVLLVVGALIWIWSIVRGVWSQ